MATAKPGTEGWVEWRPAKWYAADQVPTDGKIPIEIRLTEQELDDLKFAAEHECRTLEAQAYVVLRDWLEDNR